MAVTLVDSPLATMVERTPTDFWNDSCSLAEVAYAVERGGTGATSNPVIVGEVMRRERESWEPRVRELAAAHRTWSEVDLTWAIAEEMGVRARRSFDPSSTSTPGARAASASRRTRRCTGTPTRCSPRASASTASRRTSRSSSRPRPRGSWRSRRRRPGASRSTPPSGSPSARRSPWRGRRARAPPVRGGGGDPDSFAPVCTLMVGRLDDWVKVLVERDDIALDPAAASWAGIAAFKRAYGLYQERGYRTRLLAAAMRHRLHWTELVGGDVVLTIPHAWQVRFNASGIDPKSRIDVPVDTRLRRRPARPRARFPPRLRAGRPGDRRVRHVRPDRPHAALVHRGVPRAPGIDPRPRPAEPGRPPGLTAAT